MRSQAWRRELQNYLWHKRLHPRVDDIDTERHVNNVAVKALHAEARMRFQLERFPDLPAWYSPQKQLRPLQLVTNFLAVTHYPNDVKSGLRLLHTDARKSVWATALFQNGQCVSTHEAQLCVWENDRPAAFSNAERKALHPHASADFPALPPQQIGGSLHREDYPIGQTVTVRYGDWDAHWSLNDLVQLRCIEQIRASTTFRMMREAGMVHQQPGGLAVLMASKRVRFLRLSHAQQQVEVRLAVARLGTSSLDLAIALFDDLGCFALADGVSVFVDPETQRPKEIPAAMRDWLVHLEPVAPAYAMEEG